MGRPRYAYVYVRRRHEVAVSIIEASSISHSQTRMLLHGHELMIELPAAALIHSTSSFGCHDGEAEESERLWTICIDTAVGSGGRRA